MNLNLISGFRTLFATLINFQLDQILRATNQASFHHTSLNNDLTIDSYGKFDTNNHDRCRACRFRCRRCLLVILSPNYRKGAEGLVNILMVINRFLSKPPTSPPFSLTCLPTTKTHILQYRVCHPRDSRVLQTSPCNGRQDESRSNASLSFEGSSCFCQQCDEHIHLRQMRHSQFPPSRFIPSRFPFPSQLFSNMREILGNVAMVFLVLCFALARDCPHWRGSSTRQEGGREESLKGLIKERDNTTPSRSF